MEKSMIDSGSVKRASTYAEPDGIPNQVFRGSQRSTLIGFPAKAADPRSFIIS
jgi:hypothetical protein